MTARLVALFITVLSARYCFSWNCCQLFVPKSLLDTNTHEQTIICRQLFAGHVVGPSEIKRKQKMK